MLLASLQLLEAPDPQLPLPAVQEALPLKTLAAIADAHVDRCFPAKALGIGGQGDAGGNRTGRIKVPLGVAGIGSRSVKG